MTRLVAAYRLEFRTPFRIGTGVGVGKLVDDTVLRGGPAIGGGARLPVIPGSSLKGAIRAQVEGLARELDLHVCGPRWCKRDACIACRLFGSPRTEGGLAFTDALLVPELRRHGLHPNRSPLAGVRSGNKLERSTRTVQRQLLFSHEHASRGLAFTGGIAGAFEPAPSAGLSLPLPFEGWLLLSAVALLDGIGGGRGRGFGRCRTTITRLTVDGADHTERVVELLGHDDYATAAACYP